MARPCFVSVFQQKLIFLCSSVCFFNDLRADLFVLFVIFCLVCFATFEFVVWALFLPSFSVDVSLCVFLSVYLCFVLGGLDAAGCARGGTYTGNNVSHLYKRQRHAVVGFSRLHNSNLEHRH